MITAPVKTDLIPLPTLLATMLAELSPVPEIETVTLTMARGRILAHSITACVSVPGYDSSAVDGYAITADDAEKKTPTQLKRIGRAAAGAPWCGSLTNAHTLRILTGALIPSGAASVVMQENCQIDGEIVTVPAEIRLGDHIRRVGEDIKAGAQALTAGRRLQPLDLGLLAAIGVASVPVRRRPRVALFSTGDELREPDQPLESGALFDANRYMLSGLLDELGCVVTDFGILPDHQHKIESALITAAATNDVILTSGGMSVGDEDHVKASISAIGGRMNFWQTAIKPGKPIGVGRLEKVLFLGLPGNPAAVAVTFQFLARPMLLKLSGVDPILPWPRFTVAAGFHLTRKPGRREYLSGRLTTNDAGTTTVHLPMRRGSHLLNDFAHADVLVELPEVTTSVALGDPVAVLSLFRP
ncbi:Molybdopterin molybdenumtransferase [Azospirillaceae bacterium]